MRIKIFEMSRDLNDLENTVAAHIKGIVENWCLVKAAELDDAYSYNHHHWIDELCNHLLDSLDAIRVAHARYSQKAVERHIDEACTKDYFADRYEFVYDSLGPKLLEDEEMPPSTLGRVVRDWVDVGFGEIMEVLKGKEAPETYIRGKRTKAPYREPRRR